MTPNGVDFCWIYDSSLFTPSHIETLSEHLNRLLMGIAEMPESKLCDLPLLSKDEAHFLIHELNDTQVDYPQDKLIHELFQAQAEQTPDNIALVFEAREQEVNKQSVPQQLTYRELNEAANRLAHYLREQGVNAESLVGICVDRSLEMVIGILAILKAGGAYVPLDPGLPTVRLDYMINETGIKYLLTQTGLINSLNPADWVNVIMLNNKTYQQLIKPYPNTNPARTAEQNPHNLAYVIYTSGSTGQPKGVMTAHQGVVNYLSYLADVFSLSPQDKILQLASLSFDASVRDLIGPLTKGAQVIIVDAYLVKEPAALMSMIRAHQVNGLLSVVPSLLKALVDSENAQSLTNFLRLILVSGEALPMSLCRKARKVFGEQTLIVNQYGPTECTMTASYHVVADFSCSEEIALIGRPIQNMQVYILDSYQQPVPVGVPGELHFGGVGLARRYFNQPELTADTFIQHPFSDQPGDRLYKTGDLVRYLPDGNLVFIGRIDNQVKIRGFRVELGEIESQLLKNQRVESAVVLARADEPGNKRLVAYVVAKIDDAVVDENQLVSELGENLQKNLPDYMYPAAFMILPQMPLTPNGKVDKKALPAPDGSNLPGQYVAPQSEFEKSLVLIWAQLLDINPESISVSVDFFEIGGHSLLAILMVAEIREQLGVEVSIVDIFELTTIQHIAVVVERLFSLQLVKDQQEKVEITSEGFL